MRAPCFVGTSGHRSGIAKCASLRSSAPPRMAPARTAPDFGPLMRAAGQAAGCFVGACPSRSSGGGSPALDEAGEHAVEGLRLLAHRVMPRVVEHVELGVR